MLINSSNIGNRLKRVHFLHGECQLWLWLLLFPFFRKLRVCVIVSVWKVMKLLRSLKIFVSGTLSVFVLFSHSCNATVCSLIKLLSANSLRSNHLIGSRKNYNYVINKSCSGLRGNILYFIYLLASWQISFSNLLMTNSPEEPTLSTFQKPFKLSHNVPVSSPFSSIAQRTSSKPCAEIFFKINGSRDI